MNKYSELENLLSLLSDQNKSLFISLIILITLNIAIEIFRFISMIIISNKEKKSKKDLLKEENRLIIIEKLFQDLDRLSLYGKNESDEMLNQVRTIHAYINKNKIYIPQKYQDISNDLLDYFKNVMTDYRLKNIEKESKMFDKFYNEFNK